MLIDLKILPKDSKVLIEITTDLYVRLQQVLLEGFPYKDLNEFKELLTAVKDGKADQGTAYHMHSLLYLLNLIEDAADKQGLIQTKPFDTSKVVDSPDSK